MRTFEKYSEEYTAIEVDLNSIILRNQVRPLNKESTEIAQNALKLWLKYKNAHKDKNAYKDVLITLHRQNMARLFKAMFSAEEAKKVGKEINN